MSGWSTAQGACATDDTCCIRDRQRCDRGLFNQLGFNDTATDALALIGDVRLRMRKTASQKRLAALESAASAVGAASSITPAPYQINLGKHEAPGYVTYPYVLRGYRCGGTYARCAAALFEWHTETLNAWTMIWASCLSIFLLTRALSTLKAAGSSTTTSGSYWPGLPDQTAFWLLTTATVLHAPFSVCFHLFRGIRTDVYNLWRRLDQVFIFQVSQLLALGIAWFVYESYWGIALNTLAAFVVAQLGTRDIWAVCPDYQRNRTHMVAFVGCIVLCYWWPMGVQATRDCLAWLRPVLLGGGATAAAAAAPSWAAVGFSLGTFISLATGGAVFASGWPERALPGVFDIIGFSHQLMHVAAMAAHAFEFAFMLEMWARRRQETGV